MQYVRFVQEGRAEVGIGLLDAEGLRDVPVASMAELLSCELSALRALTEKVLATDARPLAGATLLAPVDGRTLVWAAGVTYNRSREARVEESGSPDVYDLVYDSPRPELFLKAAAWKVISSGRPIAIRADSELNVPEPELALVMNRFGEVIGYTVCNDMSSRSLEGENPLYLPQAKIYDSSCALAPGITPVWEVPRPRSLTIECSITRGGSVVWSDAVSLDNLHRELDELVEYLWRDQTFEHGVVLSTGTGIVPELSFTLHHGDTVKVHIDGVGTLINAVHQN